MHTTTAIQAPSRKINALLWTLQAGLSLLFLFAGGMKFVMSAAELGQGPLPVAFIRFIGVAEVAGALGLVLPGALRIHRELTSLAAAGLAFIMVGATVLTASGGIGAAAFPAVVGVLSAFVALKRWEPVRRAALAQA
ncbi:MAG: DoxX family protein [Polyangiaceae bacterium]|nr:DoxX family protein [Polyangiaceae bacterium]